MEWHTRRYKERDEAIQNHNDYNLWGRNITTGGFAWWLFWRLNKRYLKFLGKRFYNDDF